jgi:hypothetical protein
MPRIIKKGAEIHDIEDENGVAYKFFPVSDTIKVKKGWRPEGYENPYPRHTFKKNDLGIKRRYWNEAYTIFEAGFDACLEKLGEL